MSELFEQIFQSFWTFLGTACLLSIICDTFIKIVQTILYSFNVRKHGWPIKTEDKED